MYINIKKVKDPASVMEEFISKHGTIQSLSQKVSLSKCSTKTEMEDLMIWKYLKQGAVFQEDIMIQNTDIFEALTPKRIEIVDYLTKNEVRSIRKLSEALHRNYKNIYDDLVALEKMELIELTRSGKKRIPDSEVVSIEVVFDQ